MSPDYKKGPRRPKKVKRIEPDEDVYDATKFRRTNTKFKCSRCHQVGHTISKCTLSPPIHAIVNEIVSLSNQPPKTNQPGVAVHTRVAFVNSEATSIGNLEVNATNKGKETHDASQPFFSTPNSHN